MSKAKPTEHVFNENPLKQNPKLLDPRGNVVDISPEIADLRASFPEIEDNAKGCDPQQLCQVFVLCNNGGAFEFPPTPRQMLEAGIAFHDLYRLHMAPETGGLKRIKVEVCDAKPVINNAT